MTRVARAASGNAADAGQFPPKIKPFSIDLNRGSVMNHPLWRAACALVIIVAATALSGAGWAHGVPTGDQAYIENQLSCKD